MHAALSIMDAVQNLSSAAQEIVSKSEDEQLQSEMPVVVEIALKAAEQVLEAAGRLAQQPHSKHVQQLLVKGSHGVLEGTMKVLLVWDGAEVRNIIQMVQWAMDRLELVQGSKSMRSLVICFGGFSEAMMPLLRMMDKRQMELTNPDRKKRLLAALDHVKKNLPTFTAAMQTYIKSPDSTSKESKDALAREISSGLQYLIKAVKMYDDEEQEEEEEEEVDNMASNIIHVQRKLATTERFFIGSDLDKHLREIDQNSRAVAHVSRDLYKTKISGLCDEIIHLRDKLGEEQGVVHAHPESARARAAFDQTAETMCDKLEELDRWVADSVVDLVTNTFVETSLPINHLVKAATTTSASVHMATATPKSTLSGATVFSSPHSQGPILSSSPSTTEPPLEESLKGLDDQVKLFRRHSRRMSQVAAYAAQSSADSKRVSLIKDLAEEVDSMTSEVVAAALSARKAPGNKEAREKLDSLRHSWASKVQELTGAIDDVIDPEDFVTISEANIQQDMAKCRDCIQNGRWDELIGLVQGIAAKSRRIVEVGKTTIENASDPSYKRALSKAVESLDRAIPKMLALANKVASNPSSQPTVNEFVRSLRELLSSIHDIQEELSRGIDVPDLDEDEVDVGLEEESDPETATPATTTQERMMRKNLERLRSQPRYIGGLGKRILPTPVNMNSQSQQTSPHHHYREDSVVSYSEGFSQSFGSGDAQTQTPRRKMRDQTAQVELSTDATVGSPTYHSETLSPLSVTTASWTTPSPSSPAYLRMEDTPMSSMQATPERGLPSTPQEKAMKSYVSPLQHLVTAAKTGDTEQLPGHASALSARAIRLTEFAKSAAETVKDDTKLAKLLKVKSSEVNMLTPRMIEQAEAVARDPRQRQKLDSLEATSHQWAGHVKQLIDATQQANLPWSKTAEGLQKATKSGKAELQKQIDHVSTQTNRMVDIATMTMEAAATEEAIGLIESSNSADYELQEQVESVKVTASEIQKLTPQLLSAARMAAGKGESSAAMERLNLLSEEWATKAKVLMKNVDDVSLGMGGAADSLFISARSGDAGLLEEQSKSIKTLAESLHDIAQDSAERCTDTEKVAVVRVAAGNIVKLSARLIDRASVVAKDFETSDAEPSQKNAEDVELLRRDWASQVHLLTAHIDDMTAEVSTPLDHLVDVSLQANQRSGMAKQYLMDQFETKASFLSDQLQTVSELFNEETDHVLHGDPAIEKADQAIIFLKKLTPHAIGAARSLATEPGSAMLDHFNHLRRQWASKAQVLLANLQNITSTDVDRVLVAFDELLHLSKRVNVATSPVQKSYSNEDLSLLRERSTTPPVVVTEPSTPKAKPNPDRNSAHVVIRKKTPHTERPASMADSLPSWNTSPGIENALDASSRSIAFAAQSLKDITDDFVEDNNPLVDVAKKMAQQMSQMADYARGRGELQDKDDMINTAKAIAANGQAIVRFASIVSELCTDKKTKASLQSCAEMIPTLSTQLRIIASVKASTPDDTSADVMLVKNAQNLMRAVIRTVHAAEAACMKGLDAPEGDDEAASLAKNWKRKLYHQRTVESIRAPRGEKGLRKLDKNHIPTPSAVDSIKPAPSAMVSPTRFTLARN